MNNTKEHFIFVCPKCGHEFDYKFTDEEIDFADGLPITITSARCDKCGNWVAPIKKA